MMHEISGDIWNLADSHWIVIPTNCGWNSRGENVMGAGLAKQAAMRFPELRAVYGKVCRDEALAGRANPFMVYGKRRLILFAVKPLWKDAPQLSWKRPADLKMIEASCRCLVDWINDGVADSWPELPEPPLIAIPTVGCGNGRLHEADVLPILHKHLDRFDNVVLVRAVENSRAVR
jgi:hypothetical protein